MNKLKIKSLAITTFDKWENTLRFPKIYCALVTMSTVLEQEYSYEQVFVRTWHREKEKMTLISY